MSFDPSDVTNCKAPPCRELEACTAEQCCVYKSSAEERRTLLLHPEELGEIGNGTEWRLWWRGLNTGVSPAGKTLKECVEEFNAEMREGLIRCTNLLRGYGRVL